MYVNKLCIFLDNKSIFHVKHGLGLGLCFVLNDSTDNATENIYMKQKKDY